jgi:hypothetical protein
MSTCTDNIRVVAAFQLMPSACSIGFMHWLGIWRDCQVPMVAVLLSLEAHVVLVQFYFCKTGYQSNRPYAITNTCAGDRDNICMGTCCNIRGGWATRLFLMGQDAACNALQFLKTVPLQKYRWHTPFWLLHT